MIKNPIKMGKIYRQIIHPEINQERPLESVKRCSTTLISKCQWNWGQAAFHCPSRQKRRIHSALSARLWSSSGHSGPWSVWRGAGAQGVCPDCDWAPVPVTRKAPSHPDTLRTRGGLALVALQRSCTFDTRLFPQCLFLAAVHMAFFENDFFW